MIKEEDLLNIGYLAKPHGVKGEITFVSTLTGDVFNDDGEDLYIVCEMDGILVPFFVSEYRQKASTSFLLTIEGMECEDEVRTLSGKTVYYPKKRLAQNGEEPPMTGDSLVGYVLHDKRMGEIGRIEDVDDSTMNTLMLIIYKGNELLVPLSEELVISFDDQNGTVLMDLPEGLIE